MFVVGQGNKDAPSDCITTVDLDDVVDLDNNVYQLGDDWIREFPKNKKPFVGQLFENIDSTFKFYMKYGRTCGFDYRRSTERKDKNNKTVGKYFVCSRAGLANELSLEDSNIHWTRRTVSAKCYCPDKLIVESVGERNFSVKTFIEIQPDRNRAIKEALTNQHSILYKT